MHPLRIALLTTLLAQAAGAQVINARQPRLLDQWVYGLSGFGGIPVGDFRRHEDGGGGMQLDIGFQPFRRQPLVIRGSSGFLLYGRFNRNADRQFCDTFGTNCVSATVFYNSRYHNMSFFQIGPEFMATDGGWRPFGYALGGITLFNSWANYGSVNPGSSAPSTSLLNSHNVSSAYAIGVRRVNTRHGREMGWEVSLRFTRNAKARYLNDEGVQRNTDGSYTITPREGAANVLGIHIGLWGGPFINWNER
ncbi:MAG TPA: hypothetical protein VGR43_00535 [Dehalococcoidia bacterium]|nr:hypothetical protein [Dehalococcoidia bacterium]